MLWNPFYCGCSLQTMTKAMAGIEMVGFVLLGTFYSFRFMLNMALETRMKSLGHELKVEEGLDSIPLDTNFIIFSLVTIIGFIILADFLIRGAIELNVQNCLVWLIGNGILMLIYIICIVFVFMFQTNRLVIHGGALFVFYLPILICIFHLFEILIVWSFMVEMKKRIGSYDAIVDVESTNHDGELGTGRD